MRRVSLVLVFVIAAGTASASAEQLPRDREGRGVVVRVIRVVKSIFRMAANSDVPAIVLQIRFGELPSSPSPRRI